MGSEQMSLKNRFQAWLMTTRGGRAFSAVIALLLTGMAILYPSLADPLLWLIIALLWGGVACIAALMVIERV